MKQQTKKRGRPVKAKVLAKSPHLHLIQRRHTGKLLPHHATSYPTLAMLLLCLGVLLLSWTHLAAAAGYDVHTSVPGLPPTVAATIDGPADGHHFITTPVAVYGTCPLDTYVSLYRNDVFSGVALCDIGGSYSIVTDLFPGANQLQAKVFSRTDLAGPTEPPITIYYDPPVVVPPPTPPSSGGQTGPPLTSPKPNPADNVPITQALILTSAFSYKGFYVGSTVTYHVTISGGQAPYAVSVDWGDGQQSLLSRAASGEFDITHTYKTAGGYQGGYPIAISASDASGQQTNLQLLTIINPASGAAAAQVTGSASSTKNGLQGALLYIWPTYGLIVLMLTSFWLGERREFGLLRRSHRLKHS